MSIPEVNSRSRLIAFLKKFFNRSTELLPSGYAPSMSNTHKDTRTVDGVDNGSGGTGGGYRMIVPGHVIGVSCQFDCTAHTGDVEFRATVRLNGAALGGGTAHTAVNVTTTGVTGSSTIFPHNKYAFSTGDLLEIKISHGSSGVTTENHACLLRILTAAE